MRALGDQHFDLFADLFRDVDVFRWYEDDSGNIEIGARNSLEAKLVVEQRLGGVRTEIDFIRKLLLEIQEKGTPGGEREVSFAVDLIIKVRDESEHAPIWALHFRDLAETLREPRAIGI